MHQSHEACKQHLSLRRHEGSDSEAEVEQVLKATDRLFVSGSRDTTLRLWNARTGHERRVGWLVALVGSGVPGGVQTGCSWETEKNRDLSRLEPKVHGAELGAWPGTAGEEMTAVMRPRRRSQDSCRVWTGRAGVGTGEEHAVATV
ncbi:unnamed protein product [Dibothriocephalus latus]|uniref:Uncharacterized protein n=1 Tax=Dibothriocephalus latus TaxID=60516 RepID=A0A3P7MIX5_DIBLA|nr:unnamed protein product [Dibothriocephalus latus]